MCQVILISLLFLIMKNNYITLSMLTVLLTACSQTNSVSLDAALQNPLFAERYSEEIIERLASLQIKEVEGVTDPETLTKIEKAKAQWQKVSDQASDIRFEGKYGRFNLVNNDDFVTGGVLIYKNTLYLSTDFEVLPSPNIVLYASTVVDPRENEVFPSTEDTKLLTLESPYGMQSYAVKIDTSTLKSIVVYDTFLNRIIGFAQM
jgi:hypothetical protein